VGSVNPGFEAGDCPASSDGYLYGWHFVQRDTTTSFISINCTFQKAGQVTKMIQMPSNKHAYVFTPTSDTILGAWAVVSGSQTEFLLSHVCHPSSKCENLHLSCYLLIDHVCFTGLLFTLTH